MFSFFPRKLVMNAIPIAVPRLRLASHVIGRFVRTQRDWKYFSTKAGAGNIPVNQEQQETKSSAARINSSEKSQQEVKISVFKIDSSSKGLEDGRGITYTTGPYTFKAVETAEQKITIYPDGRWEASAKARNVSKHDIKALRYGLSAKRRYDDTEAGKLFDVGPNCVFPAIPNNGMWVGWITTQSNWVTLDGYDGQCARIKDHFDKLFEDAGRVPNNEYEVIPRLDVWDNKLAPEPEETANTESAAPQFKNR